MSRQMRVEYPGAVYHLTSRGIRKEWIFLDDLDFRTFLECLEETVSRFSFLCHGYCLMSNHYHILIETRESNLSQGMRYLNSVYAQQFNKRYDRVGHLFQGRYKGILVQKEDYLLELCRYIVMNPVRAGLVDHPAEYKWSSCRTFLAYGNRSDSFVQKEWILKQFDDDPVEARKKFIGFVLKESNSDSPLSSIKANLVLGSDEFIRSLKGRTGPTVNGTEISRAQRFLTRDTLQNLFSNPKFINKDLRNKAIIDAFINHGYTQKEIANHLKLHVVTVGRIIKKTT